MKKAFIFPGQASQYVGMGKDIYDSFEVSRNIFNKANDIMGMDLREICFSGPEEKLKKTYITQPAIFVHSIAVFEVLKEKNILPASAAGHSLGEYSALTAAGSLSFEDGLKLVKRRGELMYEAGIEKPGTMAAIIGMTPEKVYELCDSIKEFGVIQPANFNSPGQIALSGDIEAIRKSLEKAKEMGAKRAVELIVSGAFHSPLMESAQEGLMAVLEETEIRNAEIPIYSNVKAKPVQDKEKIRNLLYQQLTKPVLWQELIENMIKDGSEKFLEIGPGKVLKGLLKRIDRNVPCIEVGTSENINNLEV